MRAYLLLALSVIVGGAVAQDCSASNPCATGCCSIHGYCGTGDDFCGDDVCVANCDYVPNDECNVRDCSAENCVSSCKEKSECDPGGWGIEYANRTTCPLNVCCSKYGFCGTTEEFCGDRKVKRPSCDSAISRPQRVVGYYEGWAPSRPCQGFWPEQIPKGIYTHLNYAFATIDPFTFDVMANNQREKDLMKQLTDLKANDPGLRVNIAIGGWTFNDDGPTATTFSDIARSETNQKKFFRSLIAFMAKYGFDGVDIDWEYPVADDRNGRPEDFANFAPFMANLKAALRSTGGRAELSLTIPTSYWYLQHFDLKNLAKHVDYFNYMSYDLHGLWDKGNKWTGAFLDAHTNLTELRETMDLLWRNKISPDQVVLGLAFYGRAFTMQDTSCKSAGCLFASGGKQGPCSREVGVLLNSEIDEIRSEHGVKPTLDNAAAAQLLTWDTDQWVSYDDKETFRLRLQFASEFCLGGVMVWAVSHDTYNGSYSKMLSSLYPGQYKPGNFLENVNEDGTATITKMERIRQCRWTGCGETCQAPYVAMTRYDLDAADHELMLDGLDCPDDTVHTLCCPADHGTSCGWYTHYNGNCHSACPQDSNSPLRAKSGEIGSIRAGLCHREYQSACCTVNRNGTAAYYKLQWAQYPECDSGVCGDQFGRTLVVSTTGSGDALCDKQEDKDGRQERKLCYDDSDEDIQWDNCRYHRWLGLRPEDSSDYYCSSACPESQVRLALDNHHEDTCDGGARAFCCDDNYLHEHVYASPEIRDFKAALDGFLIDGVCPVEDPLLAKRAVMILSLEELANGTTLQRRDEKSAAVHLHFVVDILIKLLTVDAAYTALQQLHVDNWNAWVKGQGYANLVIDALKKCVKTTTDWYEIRKEFMEDVVCRLDAFSSMCEDEEPSICSAELCAPENFPELCEDPEELEDEENDSTEDEEQDTTSLEPRARQRVYLMSKGKTYQVQCSSGADVTGLKIRPLKYRRAGAWGRYSPQFTGARQYQNPRDCANPYIYPSIKNRPKMATEHILELQTIGLFFQHATEKRLVSGAVPTFDRIECTFFTPTSAGRPGPIDALNLPLTQLFTNDPARGARNFSPGFRIMAALGSEDNDRNFYLLEAEVNGIKSLIFGNKGIIASDRWRRLKDDTRNPAVALHYIRATIAVWHYILDPQVKASWIRIAKNLRSVFAAIDDKHYIGNNRPGKFVLAWDEWYVDWVNYHLKRTITFLESAIKDMNDMWDTQPNSKTKTSVKASLNQLEGIAAAILVFDPRVLVR